MKDLTQMSVEERASVAEGVKRDLTPYPLWESSFMSDGFLRMGQMMTRDEADEIVAILFPQPGFDGHVAAQSQGLCMWGRGSSPYMCYSLAQVLAISQVRRLVLHWHGLASAMMGVRAEPYSVHAFWTFPGRAGLTHGWHRDYDDYAGVAFFVYLTDVTESDGPFVYQKGSHKTASGESTLFVGPRGTAFAIDPYGIHKGEPIQSDKPRLVLWIRYGLGKNRAYVQDQTTPVGIPSEFPLLMQKENLG